MTTPPPLAARALTGTPDDLTRGCREDVARARAEAERLAGMGPAPDPLRALEAYDAAFGALAEAGARASLARNVHPDPRLREAAEACEREVDAAATELSLDPRLYRALGAVDGAGLDPASRHLLEKALRDFRRAGVDREPAVRERVRALRDELTRIGQEFGRNIKDDVRALRLDPEELAGLPDDFRRSHPPGPDGRVTLTTDNTDYVPFITYARSGRAREALWRLYRLRGHPANLEVLGRMLARRAELARLLGYASWAAYATEDKMIGGDAEAAALIARVTAASTRRLERDHAQLLARKRQDDPAAERVQPWDSAWLQERVKAEQYGFDAREARPYFEYTRVKEGVLALVGRLFGVALTPVSGAPAWHPDVEVYDVAEGGRALGRVYLDMHPRDGKYKHYAQFTLASGQAGRRLPEGVLVCNFPRPGAAPALLEHGEVKTFLHELGHLLHHVLGGHTRWATQSGVATEWDFVEAPSQMLEEWVWDPEALGGFARHVETGAPIPADLVTRMRRADEYGKGLWVRQQMFYAALSLELHRRPPDGLDATALVAELQERYTPFRHVEGTYFHASFGHLDGYSALYYTYMWSLVIAKDLFGAFRREGLFAPAPARRYRRSVLEPGGSRPAAELVQAFLGRPFSFEAFEEWLDA
ncbi:M3 family metallopeptidase [Anaeromyxobacter diazotrophicus]|uniref:Zn-dependent oligopeptidase n=1 Tax=Anaeromyxobacter diazotrophicus TaxID=2590199 RepID=A0A7I9VPZ7_9BACT|nr:M3 family metallopeptidase [Anaeromyxobacter diazotrophicus]GEJ58484.1 Zn-dependent oligopeptidase [Anaeromyxobacter diazotrophicus]